MNCNAGALGRQLDRRGVVRERVHVDNPGVDPTTDDDLDPRFVLLFAVRLKASLNDFTKLLEGVTAPEPAFSRNVLGRLREVE
jgi:hypothetical protein